MITGVVMKNYTKVLLTILILFLTVNEKSFAHCDSINGPVVKASVKALETGNINYVLIWVRPEDEKELTKMFNEVNKVRILNPEAKQLADRYFFETVVRIHRMGEGVGYTGLKSADYKPEEGIEEADIAIEKNSLSDILIRLDEKYHLSVKTMFADLQAKKSYDVNDLAAGRIFVESYVHFIHYVEGLYKGEEIKIEEMHKH